MKKFIGIIFMVFAFFNATVLSAAAQPTTIAPYENAIPIFVDGKELYMDVPARIINERTMIPVRAVTETVGCTVEWHGEDQRVVINSPAGGESLIVMEVGSPEVTVNTYNGDTGEVGGRRVTIDSPPIIIDGRVLVPLRFIAETIGFTVEWKDGTVFLYSALYDAGDPPYWHGMDFGPNLEYAEEYVIPGDQGDYPSAAEGAKLTFATMKANDHIPEYSDDLLYTMALVDLADISGEECYVYRLDVEEPSGTIGAAYAYAYQSGNIYMQGQGGQWVMVIEDADAPEWWGEYKCDDTNFSVGITNYNARSFLFGFYNLRNGKMFYDGTAGISSDDGFVAEYGEISFTLSKDSGAIVISVTENSEWAHLSGRYERISD